MNHLPTMFTMVSELQKLGNKIDNSNVNLTNSNN